MSENTDTSTGENDDNPKPKASDKELADLIKAQAAEIKRLSDENKGLTGLQEEVTKLQETLGTTKAIGELVAEMKAMAAGNHAQTEEEKAMSDLQKAAEAGDMKKYRKLRKAQME